MRQIKQLLFLLTAIAITACSTSEKTYTIEDIDGVRHVHNLAPLWGDEPKIKLEFVQKIGDLETENENYLLFRPAGVAVDGDGNILILDSGNHRIQKYSSDGKYLATIGRKGQGPGEFTSPMSMCIGTDGNIYVGLMFQMAVLTPDGKELKRIKMPYPVEHFYLTPDNNILCWSVDQPGQREFKPVAKLRILNHDGDIANEFGKLKEYEDDLLTIDGNLGTFSTDINGLIYHALFYQNAIEKYNSDGELLQVSDRQLKYDFQPYSGKHTPVSVEVGSDSNGRIWVQTYKKAWEKDLKPVEGQELEVFDNEGILLSRLPLPQNGNMTVYGDRLFLQDSDDEMCVYEYRIVDLEN